MSIETSSAGCRWMALAIALDLGSTGCTYTLREAEGKAAAPVPLAVAMADMQSNLSRLHVLVLSDAQSYNDKGAPQPASVQRMLGVIRDAQCYAMVPEVNDEGVVQLRDTREAPGEGPPRMRLDRTTRTKNPLIPVINGALQLQVQGQFSTAGTFSISMTPSLGGTLTRQAQQQLMVPISLVSLANLSKFYLGQQLTNLQYVGVTESAKAKAKDYIDEVFDTATKLQAIVKLAVDGFEANTNEYCKGHEDRPRVPEVGAAGAPALNPAQ